MVGLRRIACSPPARVPASRVGEFRRNRDWIRPGGIRGGSHVRRNQGPSARAGTGRAAASRRQSGGSRIRPSARSHGHMLMRRRPDDWLALASRSRRAGGRPPQGAENAASVTNEVGGKYKSDHSKRPKVPEPGLFPTCAWKDCGPSRAFLRRPRSPEGGPVATPREGAPRRPGAPRGVREASAVRRFAEAERDAAPLDSHKHLAVATLR